MAVTSDILATIDVTSYNSLKELYEDLLALKKDVFTNDDRIVIIYNSTNQKDLIDELLEAIDIPEFFVTFKTNDNTDGIDFKFSDSFCIYPWINLHISPIGDISPCCMQPVPFSNLNKLSIKDAHLSNYMKDLRQRLSEGHRPSSCSGCWKDEAVGKPSMRQLSKHKFKEIYYQTDYLQDNINNLQIFDLRLGNNCNLTCNICEPVNSSSIAKKQHKEGVLTTKEFNQITQATKWADSKEFWNQLLALIGNIKYLDLYGGEPLMSKPHFSFLKKLIDLGVSKDIKIDYNSNGTIYSKKFFNLWKHFKEVKISFSIDDIGERFEAQRVGAGWSDVCNNIIKYNLLRSDKFITEVYPTVSIQNVFYLPELLEWIDTQDFDFVASFNIVRVPKTYSIESLDIATRETIITKLKSKDDARLNPIIKLLNNPSNIAKQHRQITIVKV